jgi:dipeptidyl aminopeptidase/acylaminoacyl peptidase
VLPEPHEHAEPAWGPGQRSFAWSPDGASIALCRNECGYGRLAIVPLHDATAARDVAKGWHHGLDWGAAGVLAVRSGARTPPNVCVTRTDARTDGGVDGATDGAMTGSSSRTLVARGAPAGFEVVGLVEPEPVSWASDDGEVVHGMLFRPSSSDGPPPLLVDVHGGPTGQGGAHWRPFRQYFVSRGWAVLAPDHRGSTGYGRAYTQALREQWGVLDVADCASGIRAAGEQGWGDPARVAACGGSAGGLTVLLLAAQHGDLLRAVVGMYPVTDLFELAATTHRFESRYLDRIVGTLPGDAARYHDRSPVTHAASIRVPTLVLQGSNDRVVLPAQARVLVDAISAAGGTAEHHVYEGEGHGWAREETILDVYARVDDFLRHWVLSG